MNNIRRNNYLIHRKTHQIINWILPVNRWSNLSGVAYLTWGNLHEFKVLEKRISTSSLKSLGSARNACCAANIEPNIFLKKIVK